jgi:pyrroline-5-carboxylate reductase
MSERPRIGIIGGGGWLGGSIAHAIVNADVVSVDELALSYRSQQPTSIPGAYFTRDNQKLVERSDVVIVSVRPVDWNSIALSAKDRLVISVMAGIRLTQISEQLQTKRVVRSLPNAAAEVARSYTPWVGTPHLTEGDRAIVRSIFMACGTTDELATETDIDYLTGLSGSGPAFPALLATAMMNDAMTRGIDPLIARRAVGAVLIGTGHLWEKRNEDPVAVVDTFVRYQGTTAAAIEAMRAAGFDSAVSKGLSAALRKSAEMGSGS